MTRPAIAFPWPMIDEDADTLLPSPQRGEGGARSAPDEGAACPSCGGRGTVFRCPEWDATLGECCPAGTNREGCPCRSIACAACGGTGRAS